MFTLAYEIVDVFTDRPFAGNPLAVVYGAEALATGQLQVMAREFNLSETVFALPPTASGATYRARIFTPAAELPFAGHPSVGVAVTSVRRGLFPAGSLVQECGAGLLPIEVTAAGSATLTGGRPQLGPAVETSVLLDIAGLTGDDLDTRAGLLPTAGCGTDFAFLPVRRTALARAGADAAKTAAAGLLRMCVFAWDAETATAHSRVFSPGVGVAEDPATGSAALGLGVWLVADGRLPGAGTSGYTVHQGHELGRPSLLTCTVTAESGSATATTVAGHVVPIAKGEIAVPPFVG